MNPFRWDVLVTGFVLAVPVLLLGLRGDLAPDEVATRLVWCLAAGWAASGLVRWASVPRGPAPRPRQEPDPGATAPFDGATGPPP